MPSIFVNTTETDGQQVQRKSLLTGSGMVDGLNVYYDRKIGSWTPRPHGPFRLASLPLGFPGSFRTYLNQTTLSVFPYAQSTDPLGALDVYIEDVVTGVFKVTTLFDPSVPPASTVLASVTNVFHYGLIQHNDKYVAIIGSTGVNTTGASSPSGGRYASLYVSPVNAGGGGCTASFLGQAEPTCGAVSAFGRVWYGTRTGSKIDLRWTDANATGLSVAGTGSITVPGNLPIRAVHEVSRRLIVVTDTKCFLYGASNGGSPLDPTSVGGIVLLDTLQEVGTRIPGYSVRVGEQLYILGTHGLSSVGVDSFSQKPASLSVGGEKLLQQVSELYNAASPLGSMAYWPSQDALIITAGAGAAGVVSDGSQAQAAALVPELYVHVGQVPKACWWRIDSQYHCQSSILISQDRIYTTPGTSYRDPLEVDYLTVHQLVPVGLTPLAFPTNFSVDGAAAVLVGNPTGSPFNAFVLYGYTADQDTTTYLAPKQFSPSFYIGSTANPPFANLRWLCSTGTRTLPFAPASNFYDNLATDINSGPLLSYIGPLWTTRNHPTFNNKEVAYCSGEGTSVSLGWAMGDARQYQMIVDGFSLTLTPLANAKRR